MKELNNFRKFLKEDLDEGMFDKFKKELGDVIKTYKELEKAATSGGDGSSRATKDRQLKADAKKAGVDFKEAQMKSDTDKMNQMDFDEPIEEGTWGYGSKDSMIKTLAQLDKIRQMGGVKGSLELDKIDDALYRIFGDDEFHDAIDRAKDGAIDDDRFANAIGDAQTRGQEMLKFHDRVDEEELEENDTVLDEVSNSMGIFKEIDEMVGRIKEQMGPDDAFDSLVSEFEAISGGTKLLHRALKNISLDNNLMEEKDEE